MNSRYTCRRGLRRYLAGAAAARAGDEMSGPALLLLGFAVTGRAATGSGLLASLTIAGAAGGPVFGALLDRSRQPGPAPGRDAGRLRAGHRRHPGRGGPAADAGRGADRAGRRGVQPGGGGRLDRAAAPPGDRGELARGSALDALTYSAASLAGPALAAVVAAGFGARAAVLTAAALVALAVPAARSLSRPCPAGTRPAPAMAARRCGSSLAGQMAAGFAAIATRPSAAAGHGDLGGVLRRDRDAPGLLPGAGRAAARRPGPRRAADQRDGGRLAGRQRDPGAAGLGRGQPDSGCSPARWRSA